MWGGPADHTAGTRSVREGRDDGTFVSRDRVPPARSRAVLVAGGMGVAPLVFLSDALDQDSLFVMGCRSESDFPIDFIESEVGITMHGATEDGSSGAKGMVYELVSTLAADRAWNVTLIAAGPMPMRNAVARMAGEHGVPLQVSLEARMACGVGSCIGCVVPPSGPEGYLRVCKDGPVFDGKQIRWEACRDVARSLR